MNYLTQGKLIMCQVLSTVCIHCIIEFSIHELGSLPVGVALPIWSIVFQCRLHPSSKWSSDTYQLIGQINR